MIVGQRILERLPVVGLNQSELARRIPMSQSAMNNLIAGRSRSSTHLHKIARHLQTSAAYLEGETDDPDPGAPSPPTRSGQFDAVNDLHPLDRSALLRIVTSLAGKPAESKVVTLPSSAALTVALQTYLDHSPGLSWDELAHDLAMQLPMILRAAGDGVVSSQSAPHDDDDAPPAAFDDEMRPARQERRS